MLNSMELLEPKLFVEFGAIGETAVDNGNDVCFGTNAEGFFEVRRVFFGADGVDEAHDVLVEGVAEAVLFEFETHFKVVARTEGGFEAHFKIGYNDVNATVVEIGKFDVARFDEFVAAVFGVVLVDGVVDDALEVAFVVTNAHAVGESDFHFCCLWIRLSVDS